MIAIIEILLGFLARLFPPKVEKVKEDIMSDLPDMIRRQEKRKLDEKDLGI